MCRQPSGYLKFKPRAGERFKVRFAFVIGPKRTGLMSFMTLPPEINSLRMFSGAGSAPMLEAAAAGDGLASELGSAASSFGSVTSGLAGQGWQGPASQAMVAEAAPYTGWLNAAAGQAGGRGGAGACSECV